MSAHVTEVSCHSISGLRKSYNYMCSGTYYLIIGALRLPTSNSLRRGGEVRYSFSFALPYKHEWTLSYTYRVLSSPIDKSSEQQKRKTKQNTKICHVVNSATPRRTRGWQISPLDHVIEMNHAYISVELLVLFIAKMHDSQSFSLIVC